MRGEAAGLYEVISEIYEINTTKVAISPAWMATEGMKRIKFKPELHQLGYIGCHLQLRQIARTFCRRKFDPTEQDDGQCEMFPDTLQERYPRRPIPGEEPAYVLREELDDEDIIYNCDRMERYAGALLRHADAFRAWMLTRRSAA